MNIAYVSNVVYPFVTGGAEKRIYELGTRLTDRGHDVTVYGRHFWDGPSEMMYDGLRLRAAGDERPLYVDGRRSITEAIEFATAVWGPLGRHRHEHDVIVASVFPYFPVFAVAGRTWRSETPLVTTWHECWREYWWEYLGSLGAAGMAVERAVASLPQHPIAVSSVTADRLCGIGPARDRITVVPNGIDFEQIRNCSPAEDGFDLLFVGRLIEAKNVALLLEAFAGIDTDATLGIIGEGPARQSLERMVTDLGLTSRVTFLGFLDEYEDVLEHMRAATVFATPSTREGFGITLVEAMAADCTVVAVDHPNSAASEVVGDAGFLTEATVDDFGRTLDRAMAGECPATDPVDRAEQYDWDTITDQALRAYHRAITGKW